MNDARICQTLRGGVWRIYSSIMLLVSAIAVCGITFPAHSAPRENWKVSCYVYRDVNRNGIFDMGDRPFAGLPVRFSGPDDHSAVIKSNIDGFANFLVDMADKKNAEIYLPGIYDVSVELPPGWKSTSDHHAQTLEMVRRDNAPGGMFVDKTCLPIGVAPILNISGRFLPAEGSQLSDYELSAIDDAGKRYLLPFGETGRFEFVGSPGQWSLEITDKKRSVSHIETFDVANNPIVFGQIKLGKDGMPADTREPETVGFDDLTISDSLFEVPTGYHGLNWRNWISVHNRYYRGGGYVNSTISSEYIAYNSSGTPAEFWHEEPFDFIGTYIGLAWPQGEEDDVVVRAWNGEKLMHEDRLQLSATGPVYFAANYRGVTRVEIHSTVYERITLDDLSFRK